MDSGAPAIRQVTFHANGESVSRPVKYKAGVDFVVAPRRYVLDTIVAAAAERAGAEKLRQLVEQSRARSAVYDVITNRVPVTIEVDTP